ncbi:MAG: hypothetical protein ACRC1W_06355 [Shewanella sp.]
MSLTAQFRSFIFDFIRAIVVRLNADAAKLQIKLDAVSSELLKAYGLIDELRSAIANQPQIDQAIRDRAEQVTSLLDDLGGLAAELAEEFNPTPGTDALAGAITEAPTLPTPPAAAAPEVGTGVPTPAPVLDELLLVLEDAITH